MSLDGRDLVLVDRALLDRLRSHARAALFFAAALQPAEADADRAAVIAEMERDVEEAERALGLAPPA